MNNDKEKYQIICDKLLEKYGLSSEVRDFYEGEYIIYVKEFDIKCTFKNMSLPTMYCVEYVASCCYKSIPIYYIELVKRFLRGEER